MEVWTALIILQALAATPQPTASVDGPLSLSMSVEKDKPPSIALDVQNVPGTKVNKMVGVETSVTINTPTTTKLEFASQDLCEAATKVLEKQPGVSSVRCVRTQ